MIWLLLLPLWFVFNASAYLLAPVLPLFRVERLWSCDNGHFRRVEPCLPWWLEWYMTDDNSLCGDAAFAAQNGESYWSMVKWLGRNPAVGFERNVLSAKISPEMQLHVWGNPQVSDAPHGLAGACFVLLGHCWNLVCVVPTITGYCIKLDLGWQLKTYAEEPARIGSQPSARYAMTLRPTRFATQQ